MANSFNFRPTLNISFLQRFVVDVCRPYSASPRLHASLTVSTQTGVEGVAQCDNRLFVVCRLSDIIAVFGPNNEQLTSITVKRLKGPTDIVACTETKQLYIADLLSCVWRVSMDGDVIKWLPNKSTATDFQPESLSVTSRRLLVTSYNDELLLFGADGVQLKRVASVYVKGLQHAVETSRGTFIVCHYRPQRRVVEVDDSGYVIRVFSDEQQLGRLYYLTMDSDGRVFVADFNKHRVLLPNSRLELERVLLDTEHNQLVKKPRRLCYDQQTRQLIVTSSSSFGLGWEKDMRRINIYADHSNTSRTIQIYALTS